MLMLPEIELSEPLLQEVRLVRKYELKGVAFVKGCEKPVGFTFHSGYLGNLSLEIEDSYGAKDVYDFFKQFLGKSGMKKSMGSLFVEWKISKDNKEAVLLKIEKIMSVEWKDAFRTVLSVYDK